MATTDARPGFRLPWGADRSENGEPADPANEQVTDQATDTTAAGSSAPADQESETDPMIDAAPAASDPVAASEPAATPSASGTAKKPNKFLADLTKAMQAAAESAREETLSRFTAEAKTHIESIHADSATEATELRKQADDDVATIRDWSKTEIARIRDETDQKINQRKTNLETEVDEHAAAIERRIERVQAKVAAFEAEMDAFFERLLAEGDPTRFAAMAESLPEPPPFDGDSGAAWAAATAEPVEVATHDQVSEAASAEPAETADTAAETIDATATPETVDAPSDGNDDAPDDTGDLFGIVADQPVAETMNADDPRLAALGASPDFAAAEAEAAAFTPEAGEAESEIPVIADDALAARLAGLVPEADGAPSEHASTRVVVLGLVSVASIAGFKRHLSRVGGVQSVGVSSGPDGEFVFAVTHEPTLALKDAIPSLPGFGARVTGDEGGTLTVNARDPETEG